MRYRLPIWCMAFPLFLPPDPAAGREKTGAAPARAGVMPLHETERLFLFLNYANGDRDRDGIPDKRDECPYVAGAAVANGCPDTDRDGIEDRNDSCPYDAGPADRNGCPAERTAIVTTVFFASGSSSLSRNALVSVDSVIDLSGTYPACAIIIEAHTDDRGNESYNHALSRKRAAAVSERFRWKKVGGSRIKVLAWGESWPVLSDTTAAGRAYNRQVKIILMPTE